MKNGLEAIWLIIGSCLMQSSGSGAWFRCLTSLFNVKFRYLYLFFCILYDTLKLYVTVAVRCAFALC